MSARNRILIVVGIFTVLVVGASLAAYAAWTREGVIQVEVSSLDGRGSEAYIEVPGAVVPIVLQFLPTMCMSRDPEWQQASRCLPIVRKAWREIRKAPDGVLVAVNGPRERVRIEKKGEYLLVDVRSQSDHVRVRCPLRTVDAVTNRLVQVVRATS